MSFTEIIERASDKYGLTFERLVGWHEVYADWRIQEAGYWDEHFKSQGFDSWDAWRAQYVQAVDDSGINRHVLFSCKVEDSLEFVPKIWAGAYKGWRRYYPEGEREIQFCDLVRHPDLPDNDKVKAIRADFPKPTTIIGFTDGDRISLFEGMHRCSAITLEALEQRQLAGDLYIELISCGPDEVEAFKRTYTQVD